MTATAPERVLVIDDNLSIHDDFRKVLGGEDASDATIDQAAALLFRRPAKAAKTLAVQLDFASQGQEGLARVEAALKAERPYALAFVDIRMPPGWDGIETISRLWSAQPDLQVVICTAFSDYSWEEMDRRLGQSDRFLILKKPFDNVEVRQLAASLATRARLEREMKVIQQRVIEVSRQAGMAEVATGVLHNVGNVLNSVNVSAGIVLEKLRTSKASKLGKAAALLTEKNGDLAEYLTRDPNGQKLPGYLANLGEHLVAENAEILREVDQLGKNIEHIKQVVAMQQSYAKVSGVFESLAAERLIEDAIAMSFGAVDDHDIAIERRFSPAPPARVDRHKVLQILINLLRNARHAFDDVENPGKRIAISIEPAGGQVRIAVSDNGIGIPPENLNRIFGHGFTTRKGGHGFGLHSGALAAKEMGGELSMQSAGLGQGATFTLELPTANA